MGADIAPLVHQIAANLSTPLNPSTLRPIARDSAIAVADATLAYLIDGQSRADNAVLLVSNPAFPTAVADAVARGQAIAEQLDAQTARHVLRPRETGVHAGQSYGLYSRLEPVTTNRVLRAVHKKIFIPRIAKWLIALAEQTGAQADAATTETRFTTPLGAMAADTDLPDPIRRAADHARTQVTAHPLKLGAEHGDFWTGNVLFAQGRLPGIPAEFFVIDWGGARLDGYPCIDLLRYAMSSYRPGSQAPGRLLHSYMQSLHIPQSQGALYPMAALAHLGQNLDQFPKPRYVDLVSRVFDTLNTSGLISNPSR